MIRRITIKNFRSLNIDLELDPVTVLIGRSGTGKTNFVDAVRFLRDVIQNGLPGDGGFSSSPGPFVQFFPLTKNKEKVVMEFDIEFDIRPHPEVYHYSLDISPVPSTAGMVAIIVAESLKIDDEPFFERSGDQISSNHLGRKQFLEYTKCFFSEIGGHKKISTARIVLTQGLSCYDFPGTVCTGKNVEQKFQNGDLLDDAKNFNYVFDTIGRNLSQPGSWDSINALLKNLNSSIENIDVAPKNVENIIVVHRFGETLYPFGIERESEGFRRFFAHLLAIYQTPPKQTLIFEEPERGIHPGALQSLAEALKACPEEGRGQVILTTHSPQLLDHFEPESIRAVEMIDGETRIGRIAADQLESIKEQLLFPGELLTVTDARIDESVED